MLVLVYHLAFVSSVLRDFFRSLAIIVLMKRMRVFFRGVAMVGIVCTGFGLFCYANNDTQLVVTSYQCVSEKYTGSEAFRIVRIGQPRHRFGCG